MFIAMNRFKVRKGQEEDFENIWKGRDSRLQEMQGFEQFHLLRGSFNEADGYTLFASHTVWSSRDDFVAWTKSENFRAAHRNAGSNEGLYLGYPQFEGFEVVEGA
jgi:heme-degrading monooxygenase HmoA